MQDKDEKIQILIHQYDFKIFINLEALTKRKSLTAEEEKELARLDQAKDLYIAALNKYSSVINSSNSSKEEKNNANDTLLDTFSEIDILLNNQKEVQISSILLK